VIIIDEVHERHLTTDFLLALLRAVVLQRPTLRLLVMSATINHEVFSNYFGGCPVIQVPGRLHPIQVRHAHTPRSFIQHYSVTPLYFLTITIS
jgi:HrpA-like RNA helicase